MGFESFIPVAMELVGSMFSATGNYQAGDAAMANAKAKKQEADFEAAQLMQQANTALASGQAQAIEERRQIGIINSRALAVAAAGGGAKDPTVINMIARNAAYGSYRAALSLYQGQDRARTLRMQAAGRTYEGEVALQTGEAKQAAYRTAAAGSVIKGATSLYTKYGMTPAPSGGSLTNVGSDAGSTYNWLD